MKTPYPTNPHTSMGFLPTESDNAPMGRTSIVRVRANMEATMPISVFEALKEAAMVGRRGKIMPNPIMLKKMATQRRRTFR